jgi:hypothetical protein
MAGDTEDLVISVSADTKQITNAINRLLGVVNSSASGIEKAFSRSGTAMDKAGTSATRLQKQIEALTGATAFKDRGADVEAYGAQLDSLRAKYNPLFAAQQQYVKSLADINQAAKVGAISEKERAAAIATTKSSFASQVTSLKGVAANGKLASYEMINLSRQLQDVGVSLFSGQSPFTVLVQQGTQIADIFGSSKGGSVGGALKQIGSGIASVITPMRLLGVGVAVTGAAALASLSSWKSYTLQLDDTAKSVGTTTAELSKLQGAAAVRGIPLADFTKGMETFGKGVYDAKNNMGGLAEVMRVSNVHASTFDDYLSKAADIIKRNTGDTEKQFSLLTQMGLPATMQWVRFLQGGAEGIKAAKEAMSDFAGDDSMVKKAREIDEALNRLQVNFGRGWRDATLDVIGLFENLGGKATKALMSIPGIGGFIPTNILRSSLLDAQRGYSVKNKLTGSSPVDDFYSGLGSGAPGNAKPTGGTPDPNTVKNDIARAQQYLGLLGQTTTATEARRQVELQLAAAALNGVGIDSRRAEVLKKLAEENILGITAMKQQTDSLKVEAATIGMSAGQATAYAAAQNALNDARRNGRALTEENIANINKEAAALGAAAQSAAQLRLASDIKFDRSQIGLSDAEQGANSRIRSVFGDNNINSAQAQFYRQQLLINDALRQYSDMGKDAFKGIASDLLSGKSAMESFSSALNKIANKLMDMAVDSLWSKAFGGGGGGGGGGLLANIFGGAGASSSILVGNQLFPKFANGTNFAPGGLSLVGERGPELVNLPRGSQVIPNHELGGGGGTSVSVGGATVVIQGDASEKTVALIKAALRQHDATMQPKIVAAVTLAKKQRQLV